MGGNSIKMIFHLIRRILHRTIIED